MRNLFVLIALLSCLTRAICGTNAVLSATEEFKGLFDPSLANRPSHGEDDPEAGRDEKFIELSLKQMKTTARHLVAINVHASHSREKPTVIEKDRQTSLKLLDDIEETIRDVMHRYPNTRLDVSARTAAAAAHKLLLEVRAYREGLLRREFPTDEGFPPTNTAEEAVPR